MNRKTLLARSLAHYWRGNLVVVFGVAAAVAILGGALLVGDSVRGTLRDLALMRLGAVDVSVSSPGFFRDQLATDLAADSAFVEAFDAVAPLLVVEGFVTAQATGRRAGNVRVYGVDERFWRFQGRPDATPLGPRQADVSPALAEETGAAPGEPVLIRVELPSDVPLESLHGRKDDPGRAVRATVASILPAEGLGEFALNQEQGRIRAVFVSLAWLREELEIGPRVNTLVVAARDGPSASAEALRPILARFIAIEDAGLSIRESATGSAVIVGADAGLIDPPKQSAIERAAASAGLRTEPVLTYLANTIRAGSREVPYSLVTARDLSALTGGAWRPTSERPPIVLNSWAARDLAATIGDPIELEYYLWAEPGQLVTRRATFELAGVVPIGQHDRELAPVYPGISDSPTLDDWDPPFPIDLRRVRPIDETYWAEHRTSPKAFVSIAAGQRLWASRYGAVTSIRASAPVGQVAEFDARQAAASIRQAVTRSLDPATVGVVTRDVRVEALAAAEGVTDFGQYFIYFSFFLVVSALVLAALFFRLGIEERVREVGLFGAVGAQPSFVRRLFMSEALILSTIGGVLGIAGAAGYAWGIVVLLRTWWIDAVGTSALTLHVSTTSLLAGFGGGVGAALVCTWLSLRRLGVVSARALLAGSEDSRLEHPSDPGKRVGVAVSTACVALSLMVAGAWGWIGAAGAFFGGGFLMLTAGLVGVSAWYRRRPRSIVAGYGRLAIGRLGLRNAARRPARSVLAISVVASAVFILLAVDVFRKDAVLESGPTSGLGGYSLVAESLLPVAHDLGTAGGRDALGLSGIDGVRLDAFRLRPGDDTSCLNLYQPTNPRILGVGVPFIERGRFAFRASIAATDAERANPWTLLLSPQPDGSTPVIVDANSLTYVLHKAVGDVIEVPHEGGVLRPRVVASLADSLFQRELLISEAAFTRHFPDHEGYRFWLGETTNQTARDNVAQTIEDRLAAFGVDALPSADRLAEFHRVENTYLATFQTLGGLGLLLGTIGLAAVMLRNVVERRRELALLGAVGYDLSAVRTMLLAETASLLAAGLAIGVAAAAVASLPAVIERGGRAPLSMTGGLVVLSVLVTGLISTAVAARAATRQPLLAALRSE